ncbi:MAG: UDP-glucose 4-epimerase [Parcubacteria group bacterium GW2011_GWA1_Parcubacteria_45_10]|nr:MAG: UDP-glucose 4-epimerase [Parcubacteria group bacterium GW2011_GWA1_Parcubacteria_45_10]
MKILVTGGAGYVGSHTVEELIKAGHAVVVFDNLSLGHRKAVSPKAIFIKGDLRKREDVAKVFGKNKFDAVFHFAAKSLVGESMENPMLYLGDNVVSATNLFEEMLKRGCKKFILSSTANLFGTPKTIPISEDETISPGSPYGESKNIIERELFWLDRINGLKYAALRYFNAAGASPSGAIGEEHNPETHLIPSVIKAAIEKKKLIINGSDYPTKDGTCIRDYVHVTDLARAHLLALKALVGKSCVYNLGSGKGYSILEVIKTVEKVSGEKIDYEFGPRRTGDPAKLIASSDKIKRELGWKAKYGLKEIIETAYRWHKAHPRGYAK